MAVNNQTPSPPQTAYIPEVSMRWFQVVLGFRKSLLGHLLTVPVYTHTPCSLPRSPLLWSHAHRSTHTHGYTRTHPRTLWVPRWEERTGAWPSKMRKMRGENGYQALWEQPPPWIHGRNLDSGPWNQDEDTVRRCGPGPRVWSVSCCFLQGHLSRWLISHWVSPHGVCSQTR